MKQLKTAYDLACERVIPSRITYKNEQNDQEEQYSFDKTFDFIEIPEFSGREDVVMDMEDTEEEKKKKEKKETVMESGNIKVADNQKISYDNLPEVLWYGHFMDYGGFARINRTMAFELCNRNVKVKLEIEPYLNHVNKSTENQLRILEQTEIKKTSPKVFGTTIPLNMFHSGKKILYTMIETSEKVHKDYAERMNLMNEIWVATEYGKKIMQNSNVCTPSYVMPLGVDVERYNSSAGQFNFGKAVRSFIFSSVFRWSYRKGFDLLLKAYMEEFSNNDDVSLCLVSRALECPEKNGVERIVDDFNAIKSGIGKQEKDLPHVALYTKPIPEYDMPKIYSSSHAFVLISRGEGFGLPYAEAGASSIPVIASNCSGHTDFLKEDNSYLVEPEGYIDANLNGNLPRMAKLCHFYQGQKFPHFGEDSIEQIKYHMRFVYENYSKAKIKAKKLQNLIKEKYTWDMAVDRVYKRILECQ